MYFRRHLILIYVPAVVLLAGLYGVTYWRLRVHHDFVRNATYYTDVSSGKRVRTDHISLGEWRIGPEWQVASVVFFPARLTEGLYWQL